MSSVVVDHRPLATEALGLRTVGQLLAHLQKDNRLVVHVLIDGQEPDLNQMPALRQSSLNGHTFFIETADSRQLACDALLAVEEQLLEADRLRREAAELLEKNQNERALEKLAGCFGTWQNANDSVAKTAQLLRLDLDTMTVEGRSLQDLMTQFTDQFKQIKLALENRDFVLLADILNYEVTQTSEQWRQALAALRAKIAG